MSKLKRLDNIAGLIADVIMCLFLVALTSVFLILPGLAVFVHGYSGIWLIATFGGAPLCFMMISDSIRSIRKDWRKIK